MASELTISAIPHVLDDDEVPFVLGFTPDRRRSLDVAGFEYRRGNDRCSIEVELSPIWLRALLLVADDSCFLMASIGPLLNEWWPLILDHPDNKSRPVLSAGASRRSITLTAGEGPLPVRVVPSGEGFDNTTAVIGMGHGGLADDNLAFGHVAALGVIKAALLTLVEYRTLVDPVPQVNIETGGASIALDTMLNVAAAAATDIAWELVAS